MVLILAREMTGFPDGSTAGMASGGSCSAPLPPPPGRVVIGGVDDGDWRLPTAPPTRRAGRPNLRNRTKSLTLCCLREVIVHFLLGAVPRERHRREAGVSLSALVPLEASFSGEGALSRGHVLPRRKWGFPMPDKFSCLS